MLHLVRVSVRVRVRVRVRVIGFPNPNLEQQVLAVDREGEEVIHTWLGVGLGLG